MKLATIDLRNKLAVLPQGQYGSAQVYDKALPHIKYKFNNIF